jgi:hypothetical protein
MLRSLSVYHNQFSRISARARTHTPLMRTATSGFALAWNFQTVLEMSTSLCDKSCPSRQRVRTSRHSGVLLESNSIWTGPTGLETRCLLLRRALRRQTFGCILGHKLLPRAEVDALGCVGCFVRDKATNNALNAPVFRLHSF